MRLLFSGQPANSVLFLIFALKSEDKLHIGIKNEPVHFILQSVCIIFAP